MENPGVHPSGSQDFQRPSLCSLLPPQILDNLVCCHPVCCISAGQRSSCSCQCITSFDSHTNFLLTVFPLGWIRFREHTGWKPQQLYGERNSLRLFVKGSVVLVGKEAGVTSLRRAALSYW